MTDDFYYRATAFLALGFGLLGSLTLAEGLLFSPLGYIPYEVHYV